MTQSHMPGPWLTNGPTLIVAKNEGWNREVAIVKSEANAHLIAAAPEMLDVLEAIEAELSFSAISSVPESIIAELHKAIAKAKGQQS